MLVKQMISTVFPIFLDPVFSYLAAEEPGECLCSPSPTSWQRPNKSCGGATSPSLAPVNSESGALPYALLNQVGSLKKTTMWAPDSWEGEKGWLLPLCSCIAWLKLTSWFRWRAQEDIVPVVSLCTTSFPLDSIHIRGVSRGDIACCASLMAGRCGSCTPLGCSATEDVWGSWLPSSLLHALCCWTSLLPTGCGYVCPSWL